MCAGAGTVINDVNDENDARNDEDDDIMDINGYMNGDKLMI